MSAVASLAAMLLLASSATSALAQLQAEESILITQTELGEVEESGDNFAEALLAHDLFGGGFASAIFGTPQERRSVDGSEVRCGLVQVVPGSVSGLDFVSTIEVTIDDPILGTECEEGDRFGAALAAGDFDGDSSVDLVVAAPGRTVGAAVEAGAVLVIYGDNRGPSTNSRLLLQNTATNGGPEVGDGFGSALAVGRFNDDSYDDLIVGSPYEDVFGSNEGMLHVYYGNADGLPDTPDLEVSVADLGAAAGSLGWAFAVGDFDADGRDDLGASVWARTVGPQPNAGGVLVFPGSASGLSPTTAIEITQDLISTSQPENRDRFGFSFATGDFDGDAHDDLAISAVSEDDDVGSTNDAGIVHVVFGSPGGLQIVDGTPNLTIRQADLGLSTQENDFDRFGETLAAGDFDGDGDDELVIGVPFDDNQPHVDQGVAYVLGSRSRSLDVFDNQFLSQITLGDLSETNDLLAQALAAGDFDGNGAYDLLISAPGDTPNASNLFTGLVHRVPGVPILFFDDFESGDLSYWSASLPE